MRTTITLDADAHEYASIYASANGISLSAAINDLIQKAQTSLESPRPAPEILRGPNGLPMFPASGGRITAELIKELEEEEFDPQKYS